jgi:hypothetical protein
LTKFREYDIWLPECAAANIFLPHQREIAMKKQVLCALLLILVAGYSGTSQTKVMRSPFVSINIGGFMTSLKDFSKIYDSNLGFAFGAGLGLPMSSRTYLYGKATYFAKSGIPPVIYRNIYSNAYSESGDGGRAYFRQWIINVGIQYNLFLSDDFTLGMNGGVTYTRVSETLPIPGTGVSSSLHGSGALGMFGGLAIEKNFLESPFSIFAEAQHNFVRHDLIDQVGDYGGANLTLGIRYYFRERRTS